MGLVLSRPPSVTATIEGLFHCYHGCDRRGREQLTDDRRVDSARWSRLIAAKSQPQGDSSTAMRVDTLQSALLSWRFCLRTTAGRLRNVGTAFPWSTWDFDRSIRFLVATIEDYKRSDLQYFVVLDQDRVARRLLGVATFDAESPITQLGVVGGTHW
jgi:hypothetical protein